MEMPHALDGIAVITAALFTASGASDLSSKVTERRETWELKLTEEESISVKISKDTLPVWTQVKETAKKETVCRCFYAVQRTTFWQEFKVCLSYGDSMWGTIANEREYIFSPFCFLK